MALDPSNSPRDDASSDGHSTAGRTEMVLKQVPSRMSDVPLHSPVRLRAMSKPGERSALVVNALWRSWIVLLILGALCSGPAGFAGWKLAKPTYRSVGLLRIAYTLPPVMQVTDQNQPLQMFDTFMRSQELLITSRRVTDMAVEDPVWRTTGRQIPADPDQYFASNLKVTTQPRSEYLEISVTDSDPGTAAAAVNSVINAYVDVYNNQSKDLEAERIGVLEDAQKNLEKEVDDLQDKINQGIDKYGTSNLHPFYEEAMDRVGKVKAAIDDARAAMAVAHSQRASADPLSGDPLGAAQSANFSQPPPSDLSDEEIAVNDPTMRQYLARRDALSEQLKRLQFLGYGEEHEAVKTAKFNLLQAQRDVAQYGDHVRAFRAATGSEFYTHPGAATVPGMPAAAQPKSFEELQMDVANLTKLYQEERTEMVNWGTEEAKYDDLTRQVSSDRDQLTTLSHRMDVLQTEASLGGRLSVISTGEIPLSPERDRRWIFGGAAAVAGLAVPAGMLALLALAGSRKYLYSDETEVRVNPKAPLLGIVPALNGGGLEEDADAARSIHQIRVMLRSQAPRGGASVYLVSSASAGEGKTSLTMSLGLSFGAARLRALVIDGDLVGYRLTRALRLQNAIGLREAVVERQLNGAVQKTTDNVFVVPVGRKSVSANALPSEGIRDLLQEARKKYDVVLIDTGPVLSSVEAAVLAQEVDGTIFVIGRGQPQSIVERAVRRLDSLGARLEGFVFNRAQPSDFLRASYGSSSSHRSSSGGDPKKKSNVQMPEASALMDFDPLVRAVISGLIQDT